MPETTYWAEIIIAFLIIIVTIQAAIVYFSRKKIRENRENLNNVKEQFAKGEISEEEFDKLADKLNLIGRNRLGILIVFTFIFSVLIVFVLYSMYFHYTIDCSKPMQYSWLWRQYNDKCFGSSGGP